MTRSAPLYGETLNRPAGFNLDELLLAGWVDFQSAGDHIIQLELWCRRDLKDLLWEMRLGEDQWITPQPVVEGWFRLTVSLPWTWQLRMWLLSQGSKVQVIEPVWLLDEIRGEFAAALSELLLT